VAYGLPGAFYGNDCTKGLSTHSPPCGQRTSWAFGNGVTHARVRFFVAKLNEQKMEAVYLDDSNRMDATAKED